MNEPLRNPHLYHYEVVHIRTDSIAFHVLRARLLFGTYVYGRCGPRTVRTGPRTLIKWGRNVHESEAEAMQYIANNTTVPVPKVHRVYKYNDVTVIEMEFVPGKEAYVLSGMSQTAQRALLDELESYVKQIRNLAPPTSGLVASAYGNPSRDHRFGTLPVGPFSDHEGFHRFLRKGGDLEYWDADRYRVVIQSHTQQYISKFTHGDLAPRNVLVHKGRISAIIDWDCAGWRPEYWEVTKAQFSCVGMGPQEWLDALTRASGGTYDLQLRAERTLWSAAEFPSTPVQTWSSPGVKDDNEGDDELQLSAT